MMKGLKDGQGNGTNHRVMCGGGSSGASGVETGALFPRLHVKETKRDGPRAPPRNKMALYEHFAFPSHRFAPPSVTVPTSGCAAGSSPYSLLVLPTGEKMPSYEQFTFPPHRFAPASGSLPSSGLPSGSSSSGLQQSSSYDGSRYYCPPPYGNMGRPYMGMNIGHHAGQQPFMNGSGCSTVADSESEVQRATSISATSGGPSSHGAEFTSPRHSTHANVRSTSSKKGRTNDDCTVPIYSAPKTNSGFPKVYFEGLEWSKKGHLHPGMDITKAYQSMPVSYGYQMESADPTSTRGDCREISVTGVTGENRVTKIVYSERGVGEESEQPEGVSAGPHKEKQVGQSRSRYSHHSEFRDHGADLCDQPRRRRKSKYFDDMSEAEGLRSCATGNGECLTVLEDDEDFRSKHRKSFKSRPVKDSEVRDSLRDHPQPASEGPGKKEKRLETDKSRKQTTFTECRSNTPGSSDDNVENPSDGEVSVHTQATLWTDSEESNANMVEADSSPKITPIDLINAVGQQEFWNARKLLQRQQVIFSSQVFELHCLIKVQQLLAGQDCEDAEGDDQEASPSPLENPSEKVQAKKTAPEKQGSRHGGDDHEQNKGVTVQQPGSTCQPPTSKRAFVQPSAPDPQFGVEDPALTPVLPVDGTSGTSGAWGYPPFVKPGASGWYGAIPALNGAYMYQPYPGPYPQPQSHTMGAFNGPYRPVMCAPPMDVFAMSSYGVPGYEQRPDLMQDMYRYNSMQQHWQAAMYCNSMAQDPSASLYSVPPMPYMDPTKMSRWYEEMASSHSPPGFHSQPQQSSGPVMPTAQPVIYPMHPPWSEAGPSQLQGREGERFRVQSSWPVTGRPSDQGFQRPVPYSAQESGASSQGAECGWEKAWEATEGKSSQESDGLASDVPAAPQYSSADVPDSRVQKRLRENVPEVTSSVDGERRRNFSQESNPDDVRRNALLLFPLVPVADGGEKQKSSNHSYPGVIKVVPRAMVATAESAAEILLSIQKQREQ